MPIARAPTVRRTGARYYYPRWQLDLAVPIEAAQPAGTDTSGDVVKFTVPVEKFTIVRNDHNEADTLEVTTSWHYAGVDPRLLQSATGTLFLGESEPGSTAWSPTTADVQFLGVMQRPKRVGSSDKGLEVELLFHDYTAFFLACKKYDTKRLVPEYTDTLSSAWARICANTGLLDPNDPQTILPTTKALGGVSVNGSAGLVFQGGASDVTIGSAVPARFRGFGKISPHPGKQVDVWSIWKQCCGMLGLITYMRGDQCIVTTATNYYSDQNPARFVWGDNIKSLNDERDASVTGKGICIQSFNSLTGTTIEGFYPPIGDASVQRKKISAKAKASENNVVAAEDREVYAFPGIGTQDAVNTFAQRVYEEYSRQEYQGRLVTHEMRVVATDGLDFDLLTLYDGDSIHVEVNKADLEALGQFPGDDSKIGYLVGRRGYDVNVAKLVVKNLTGVLALPPVFLTKRVQIDGSTTPEGGTLSWDISFCNRILADGGTADTTGGASASGAAVDASGAIVFPDDTITGSRANTTGALLNASGALVFPPDTITGSGGGE